MAQYTITVTEEPISITATETVVNITISSDPVISIVTAGEQGPPGPPGAGVDLISGENKDGTSILKGMPVAIHSSGSGFIKASTTIGHQAIALANEDMAISTVGDAVSIGILENTNWTSVTGTTNLVSGSKYYLSDTPGQLVTTDPTGTNKVFQLVGIAISSTKLRLILYPYIIKRN